MNIIYNQYSWTNLLQKNSYKSKLDELKKKYLGSEEEIKKDDKK